jgi:2-polyprenyl-3-methyl-5-hydroxy-6-metoxy-1,4-benzoquinol methylase
MLSQQLSYIISCIAGQFQRSRKKCPQCGSSQYSMISRKRILTSLVQCRRCCLRYRVPQDAPEHYFDFYQTAYTSSLATQCPSAENLDAMLSSGFKNTEKNFDHSIQLLTAIGLEKSQDILDYGASWGYATWQFQRFGFSATGYEISKPRAKYAREQLKVNVVDSEDQVADGSLDCVFSSHVLEHVPAPRIALDFGKRVLRPGGWFVALTPNGSDACRKRHPREYNHSWGRLHPLYLNAEFYERYLADYPFLLLSSEYGEQYDLESIAAWDKNSQYLGDVSKRELLLVAKFK